MLFYEVIPTRIFHNGSKVLTYYSDLKLKPGHIVLIPFGKTFCTGVVYRQVAKPAFECKPIAKLLYNSPLPGHLLKAAVWLSEYYLSPLSSTVSLLLPIGINKKRRQKSQSSDYSAAKGQPLEIPLNKAQQKALNEIKSTKSPTKLLFGVTGSGKTNIYLKLAKEALERKQSVILLVPEIALTSQLVQIFESTFTQQITLMHSKQTEAERHIVWESLLNSNQPQIVIGPRSALFAPLNNLGLIIIDEAHETSYFQENAPKYSSLRLASFIATNLNITCLLGTATPLVSDYYLAKTKDSLITLTEKAKDTALAPTIKIIDFTSRENFTHNRYFSNQLLEAIKSNLERGYQTLIYHNRRGSAPMTICESCGWQALCPNCFLPLTLHSDSYSLICHTCGHQEKIPVSCPDCHHPSIIHKGFGTKLLETELKKLFKDVAIARFDADNKKNESLDALYPKVKSGEIKIIIGTQTVSRGLDLPHLATIGIVQADSGLFLPDFSNEERTFELLTQVIGRVGRGHIDAASVFIQTYQPESPIIKCAVDSDYQHLYNYVIKKRRAGSFPPFSYLAKLVVTYKTEQSTLRKVRSLSKTLHALIAQKNLQNKIDISQPIPCFHERTTSGYSWQIIVKSSSRSTLLDVITGVDAKLTLDPPSLL